MFGQIPILRGYDDKGNIFKLNPKAHDGSFKDVSARLEVIVKTSTTCLENSKKILKTKT